MKRNGKLPFNNIVTGAVAASSAEKSNMYIWVHYSESDRIFLLFN